MKASLTLLWHRLFNRKNLRKVESMRVRLWPNDYEYGQLITGFTKDGDEMVRYIKDGWVVKTDGLYPRHLIIRDKIRSFFRFTVSFWYLDLIRFSYRVFPSIGRLPADSRFAKIVFWPLKDSWK